MGCQEIVGEGLHLGPVEPGVGRPAEDAGHGPETDARLAATYRWLQARTHFWRRISRILRMDSRSVPIPLLPGAGGALDHPASLLLSGHAQCQVGRRFPRVRLAVHDD